MNTAFIMAGGKGTRLVNVTKDEIPKPMVQLCGKPLLQYVIENLRAGGVTNFFISVGHLHEHIMNYFGDGSKFNVHIEYIIETEPLGSGGALYYLKGKVNGDFVACNGDTLFNIDIKKMYKFHKKNHADITLLTRPSGHPHDCDLVVCDEHDRVINFSKKGEHAKGVANIANIGFFIFNSKTLDVLDAPRKICTEHDFIMPNLASWRVFSYKSFEYAEDMGTEARYATGEPSIKQGMKSINAKGLTKVVE